MSLNGIAHLSSKAARQKQKLEIAQAKRQGKLVADDGTISGSVDPTAIAYRALNRYDLTLLPRAYDLNEDVTEELQIGRPWVVTTTGATTDTLITLLDPSDINCYSGSGTTLVNLNQEGVNGILQNGATVTNGVIVLDGVNDYVSLGAQPIKWESGEKLSVMVWFKTSSTGVILGQQDNNNVNGAGGYVPALYVGSTGKLQASVFWHGGGGTTTSSASVNNGAWHQAVVTYNGTVEKLYLDGASVGSRTASQSSYAGTYYYFLGAGSKNSWPTAPVPNVLAGSIGLFEMQQRAYTDAEVLANYNKQKTRFGL